MNKKTLLSFGLGALASTIVLNSISSINNKKEKVSSPDEILIEENIDDYENKYINDNEDFSKFRYYEDEDIFNAKDLKVITIFDNRTNEQIHFINYSKDTLYSSNNKFKDGNYNIDFENYNIEFYVNNTTSYYDLLNRNNGLIISDIIVFAKNKHENEEIHVMQTGVHYYTYEKEKYSYKRNIESYNSETNESENIQSFAWSGDMLAAAYNNFSDEELWFNYKIENLSDILDNYIETYTLKELKEIEYELNNSETLTLELY